MIVKIEQEYDLCEWAFSTIMMGVCCAALNIALLFLSEINPPIAFMGVGWLMACYSCQILRLASIWAHSKIKTW
jgi:hypothetical protein